MAFDAVTTTRGGGARRAARGRLYSIALMLVTLGALACSRPRVLVLGLDGADWDVIDPLIDAGYLPTIGGIVGSGVRAHLNCRPANPAYPCYCPPVWMTVATGRPFDVHGIGEGTQIVDDRKATAIWTVLDRQSSQYFAPAGTSTLIAWHNLWPPEPGVAYVVTRTGLRYASDQIYDRIDPKDSLRLADASRHTSPSDLFQQLGLLPHTGERRTAWGPLAMDRVAMTTLDRIAERGGTTLTMIILHAIDKEAHVGWAKIQARPEDAVDRDAVVRLAAIWTGPVYSKTQKALGDPVGPMLEADAWLGRHLALADYDYILLASDHGMTRNSEVGPAGAHGMNDRAAHEGIFALAGPGVIAGRNLGRTSVLNVGPTLAYLLDLPVAEDQPGAVLEGAFAPEHLARKPIRSIESWDP